ncbi:hypothetical protein L9F63_010708 [Diploptera punctata]|uniref:CRAL-TRIO domain-containing protein n=1 Tax=Diploptera punctata TaxID=6984 RepID=A0AAD8EQ75_DIPPU|nr:hypothetical protein L9F63_010708 [Diploptera punctata]
MSELTDLRINDEKKERVRKNLDLDEERIKAAVQGIKDWMELQPHLPKEDDGRLERWLIRCKNNMEKTKHTLDMYYSLKTQIPELMSNWNVDDTWAQELMNQGFIIPLPKLTDELDRITIFGLYSGVEDFEIYSVCKTLLMSLEIRMCEDYNMKDIIIIDFKNITAKSVLRITLPAMKKFVDCALKGYNMRIRAIHLINSSPITEVLITISKALLKNKLIDRLHVHGSDLTALHKHVPKSLLPKEYGGENGTVTQHDSAWKNKLTVIVIGSLSTRKRIR